MQSTTLWCQHCEVMETPGEEPRHETEWRCQRRRDPELVGPGARARLVVLAVEVGGRWSPEATDLMSQLVKANGRSEPFLVRRRTEQAWRMRWTGLLACAAARSSAASLLGLHGGRGADGFAPRSHEVECDHRFSGSSGQCAARCGEVTTSFGFLSLCSVEKCFSRRQCRLLSDAPLVPMRCAHTEETSCLSSRVPTPRWKPFSSRCVSALIGRQELALALAFGLGSVLLVWTLESERQVPVGPYQDSPDQQ